MFKRYGNTFLLVLLIMTSYPNPASHPLTPLSYHYEEDDREGTGGSILEEDEEGEDYLITI